MTCAELLHLLDDYLTGQLFEEQRQLVEWHIATCEHCRTQVVSYRFTVLMVRRLPRTMPLPPHLAHRLWQLLQQELDEFNNPTNGEVD
jgi:anti-sigma factor RsiW